MFNIFKNYIFTEMQYVNGIKYRDEDEFLVDKDDLNFIVIYRDILTDAISKLDVIQKDVNFKEKEND